MQKRWEAFSRWVAWDFVLLVLFVVLLNARFFLAGLLPAHDTARAVEFFHHSYNHFYWFGTLPKWDLYGTFGVNYGWLQLAAMTPLEYIALGVGRLLGVGDTLLLFQLSMLAEQLVLLAGVYRLGRFIYRSRAAVLMVCMAVMGTAVWDMQIWWNFRIYYLLPWVVYCLFVFFLEARPAYFWLAGIAGVFLVMGNVVYYVIPWALVLLALAAVLTARHGGAWRALFSPRAANVLALAVFLVCAVVLVVFLLYTLEETAVEREMRDPETGRVDLETFLLFGGKPTGLGTILMVLFGRPVYVPRVGLAENTFYLGLLPLAMLGYAFWRARGLRFAAVLAAAFVLMWFATGFVLAPLLYHVPGVAYFRYLGQLYGLVRVLVLLCAGFGMDALMARGLDLRAFAQRVGRALRREARRLKRPGKYVFALELGALLGLTGVLVFFVFGPYFVQAAEWGGAWWLLRFVGYGAGLGAVWRWGGSRRWLAAGLLAGCAVDMVSYQATVPLAHMASQPVAAADREVFRVASRPFSPQRVQYPPDPVSLCAMRLLTLRDGFYFNTDDYNVAGYDVCWPSGMIDQRAMGVSRLLGWFAQQPVSFAPEMRFLGRGAPVFRLEGGRVQVVENASDRMVLAVSAGREGWLVYEDAFLPKIDVSLDGIPLTLGGRPARLDGNVLSVVADPDSVSDQIVITSEQIAVHVLPGEHEVVFEVVVYGAPFIEALGCQKFRIASAPVFVESQEEAEAAVLAPEVWHGDAVVLRGVPEARRQAGQGQGTVEVVRGNANEVVLDVQVDGPAWLVYYDAYNSRWRATVNGEPVPVVEANLAFKAVPLAAGPNRVHFRFDVALPDVLAGFGLAAGVAAVGLFLAQFRRRAE